jgi:hypothetical protein
VPVHKYCNPYTCAWGGNRRGLGREEEGPSPIPLPLEIPIYYLSPEDIDKPVSVGAHLNDRDGSREQYQYTDYLSVSIIVSLHP